MVTTFRAMRSVMVAAALGAACGGGDPPGGGNGDTDGGGTTDGTTGNGGTDGYVPDPNKPLVEAIPGLWELVELDGQGVCCPSGCDCDRIDCADARQGPELEAAHGRNCPHVEENMICAAMGCVVVDPSNPTCRMRFQVTAGEVEADLGPPGDACVWGFYGDPPFILDGATIRSDPPLGCPTELPHPWFCVRRQGEVLDNGTRMEYTQEEWTRMDRSDLVLRTHAFRKVR